MVLSATLGILAGCCVLLVPVIGLPWLQMRRESRERRERARAWLEWETEMQERWMQRVRREVGDG